MLSLVVELYLDCLSNLQWGEMKNELVSCSVMSDSATPWTAASGSSVHEVLQARILEWVAIPFSRKSSPPRDGTWSLADSLRSEPPRWVKNIHLSENWLG